MPAGRHARPLPRRTKVGRPGLRLGAALTGAWLAVPALAVPPAPVHWVSLCAEGRALYRLLPSDPDGDRGDRRHGNLACHAVLACQRKSVLEPRADA